MMEESATRGVLEAERRAALGRVQAVRAELESILGGPSDSNADNEHDPEGSTVAYERARVAGLLGEAQSNLDDLDRALARLAHGTYSACETCGRQISPERPAARPAARTCIECARHPD